MIGDPPVAVDVTGTLQDGAPVNVSFDCKPDSAPETDFRSARSGHHDMPPD